MDRSSNAGEADLARLRAGIDRVDRSIVELIGERLELARRIGAWKDHHGRAQIDRAREREVFARAATWARGRIPPALVHGHMELLVHGARAVQTHARVAYLGPFGTHSETVVHTWFPEAEALALPDLESVVAAVGTRSEFAVVPWWNRHAGIVLEVHQALVGRAVAPLRWINVPVTHVLAGAETFDRLFARPEPYAAAREELERHWPHAPVEFVASNAEAALRAASAPSAAALTTASAAAHAGLPLLVEQIDGQHNLTTFAVLAPLE